MISHVINARVKQYAQITRGASSTHVLVYGYAIVMFMFLMFCGYVYVNGICMRVVTR